MASITGVVLAVGEAFLLLEASSGFFVWWSQGSKGVRGVQQGLALPAAFQSSARIPRPGQIQGVEKVGGAAKNL